MAELAEAVDQAQLLLWALAGAENVSAEARALYGRIESVRVEIEALRGAGSADPGEILITEWLELLARTAQQSRPASGGWARRPGASRRRPKIR